MIDTLSPRQELVITNTNVTQAKADKFNVTVANLTDAVEIEDKADIEDAGLYFIIQPQGSPHVIKGYTASFHSQKEAYDSLTDEQRVVCFWDGYKRRMINSPDSVAFNATLGIIERSAKTKAEDAAYNRAIEGGCDEAMARKIAYNR